MPNGVFPMFYFYEYKIRGSGYWLSKTWQWFQTQTDISQTKSVVLVKFEIRTVKLMGNRKRANRVYIGDSENQHLISLSVVFNREWVLNRTAFSTSFDRNDKLLTGL